MSSRVRVSGPLPPVTTMRRTAASPLPLPLFSTTAACCRETDGEAQPRPSLLPCAASMGGARWRRFLPLRRWRVLLAVSAPPSNGLAAVPFAGEPEGLPGEISFHPFFYFDLGFHGRGRAFF